MAKVSISMPPDSTFLSSAIYEGLLYLIKDYAVGLNLREIEFEDSFLSKAYADLDDSKIDGLKIVMTGNDNINSKIFEKLGLNVQSRKTYYDLLRLLKENSRSILSRQKIELELKISKKDVLIDVSKKSEGIAAPQILKIDRYTGLSSLESAFTSNQLTLYVSAEAALISLLGIYSAFLSSIRQQEQNYYFFLFFSPDEVTKMLGSGEKGFVRKCMILKNKASEELRSIIENYPANELIAIDCALNLELRELLRAENLEKIAMLLFKIAPEGQTYKIYAYKIYEVLPIEIYGDMKFYDIAARYFDAERLTKNLIEAISPQGAILRALSTLNKRNRFAEAENVLSAVQGLYRFVTLGDAQGYFEFLQNLNDACRKAENESRSRAEEYRKLISKLR